MGRFSKVLLASLLACGGARAEHAAVENTPLYVGVLENIQARTGEDTLTNSGPHVRIAFYKRGHDWVAMDSHFTTQDSLKSAPSFYPSTVAWTVVFDGKKRGQIESAAPKSLDWYSDVGIEEIKTPLKSVPVVATGAGDFSYQPGKAKSRPLVLVSAENYRDPDGWKLTQLSPAEKAAALLRFRVKVKTSRHCSAPEEGQKDVPYADSAVKTLKAYRSNNGTLLVGLRLDDPNANCGLFDDPDFYDYWFVANRGQNPRLLGSEMQPMEAADLDNSGKSQWVFHTSSGENHDGYVIYWDDFSKKASFGWTYH
jgi:hypothetical protein